MGELGVRFALPLLRLEELAGRSSESAAKHRSERLALKGKEQPMQGLASSTTALMADPMEEEEGEVESTAFLGRIYRISSPSFDKVYVGSTRKALSVRLNAHKRDMRKWERGKHHYTTSYELVGLADVTIDLIEEDEYQDMQQMRDRERYWIERLLTVNQCMPGRSHAEAKRICNARRIPCPVCGNSVLRHAIKKHQRTRFCQAALARAQLTGL